MTTEIPLPGGDVTEGVVRVGDTVRRPLGPHSPLVHDVLRHLEREGFDGAPRFLGIDEQGREILTYVEGEVAGRPLPDWVADEERIASVARLVRRYDDAVAGLGIPETVQRPDDPPGAPDAPAYEDELIAHLDVTPDNVVFRDGEAVALIDFDLLKPATRTDELLNVMLWWAPLIDPVDRDPVQANADVPGRCRLIADAYGLSEADRKKVVEVGRIRNARAWYLMKHRAETMGGGWQRMWDDGVGDVIRRRSAWFDRHADLIHQALLG